MGLAAGPECSGTLQRLHRGGLHALSGTLLPGDNMAHMYRAGGGDVRALVRGAACFLSALYQVRAAAWTWAMRCFWRPPCGSGHSRMQAGGAWEGGIRAACVGTDRQVVDEDGTCKVLGALLMQCAHAWQAHMRQLEGCEEDRAALLVGLEYLTNIAAVDADEVRACCLGCKEAGPARLLLRQAWLLHDALLWDTPCRGAKHKLHPAA